MRIEIRRVKEASILQPVGDIDMSSSPQLREELLNLLKDPSSAGVVVNMERVEYIDSSGIASLVEGLKYARRYRERFCLAGLNDRPRHVLQLTRLLDIFEVHPSESDALNAWQPRP